MKNKRYLFIVMIFIIALTAACGGKPPVPPATEAPVEVPASAEPAPVVEAPTEEAVVEEVSTDFPLPEDVQNMTDLGGGAITFQTTLSLPDAVTFYRFAFFDLGYTEREILTSVEETTFNLVFDGHPSGKAIVVQGVNLGESVNISIRLEDA